MDTLNKIFYLLKKNGISEIEFAKRLNISRSTITDWKRGKTKSYNKRLPQIANVLGVQTEYLITNSDNIFQPSSEPSNKDNIYIQQSEGLTNVKAEENIVQYLTDDEKILLDNYRKLDHRGKTRVNNFIYEEIDYIAKNKGTKTTSDFKTSY